MRIILAGTPNFSVPVFERIIENHEVLYIISQPDKKSNRGYKLDATPTKTLANKYNIKILQPEKIGNIWEELKDINFDIFLTVAYGQYIPSKILGLAKKASLNIHGSLLPKYRGASPIQASLLNGDKKTGISLIYMSKIMDAGNIINQIAIPIEEWDDSQTLFDKLSLLAADNIIEWLNDFELGNFIETVQDESKVTFSSKLQKQDAFLDLENTNSDFLIKKIKSFALNPGCWTYLENGKRIKLFLASKKYHKQVLFFKTKDEPIYIYKYQIEGKKIVDLTNLLK